MIAQRRPVVEKQTERRGQDRPPFFGLDCINRGKSSKLPDRELDGSEENLKTRLATLTVGAMAIIAIAGGCGGSDSDSGSGEGGEPLETSSLSKQAYIKKASAACRRRHQNLVGLASVYVSREEGKDKDRPVVIADMGRAVMVPTIEGEIAAIRRLGAPAGDEGEIEAILEAEEEEIEEIKQLDEAKSVFQLVKRFDESSDMFKEYGFTSCANGL